MLRGAYEGLQDALEDYRTEGRAEDPDGTDAAAQVVLNAELLMQWLGQCSIQPPAGAQVQANHVGNARILDGREYALLHQPNGAPAIVSKNTGRIYGFSWDTIVELAQMLGVDEPRILLSGQVN